MWKRRFGSHVAETVDICGVDEDDHSIQAGRSNQSFEKGRAASEGGSADNTKETDKPRRIVWSRRYKAEDWPHKLHAISTDTCLKQQTLSAESALSLYAGEDHAGIVLWGTQEWDWKVPEPLTPSEALAQGCLRVGYVRFATLRCLFDLLPTKQHERHISASLQLDVEPRSITLGACIHGGIANVQLSTKQEVWTTRLLCHIIQVLSPDSLFSSIFLHLNVPSGQHADSHNHTSIDNTLIPLSVWRGG